MRVCRGVDVHCPAGSMHPRLTSPGNFSSVTGADGTREPCVRAQACTAEDPCPRGRMCAGGLQIPCIPGKYQNTLGQSTCKPCLKKTWSATGFQECVTCPPSGGGAVCDDGKLAVLNGWWFPRSGRWLLNASSSSVFYRCLNEDACSTVVNESTGVATARCDTHYEGPACRRCTPGSVRFGRSCRACIDSPLVNVLLLALASAFALGYAFVHVRKASRMWTREAHEILRDRTIGIVKIVITYLQQTVLIGDYDLVWPRYMQNIYDAAEVASSSVALR